MGRIRSWLSGMARKAINFVRLDGSPIDDDDLGVNTRGPVSRLAARAVGDGQSASVLMAPVVWLARTLSRVPIAVLDADGAEVDRPELTAMLDPRLMFSAAVDLTLYGDAYVELLRGGMGQVEAMRFLSYTWIEPRPIFGDVIEHVRVVRRGTTGGMLGVLRYVHADDLIHPVQGTDPTSPATGLSPLLIMVAEVAGDLEAARTAITVLRNRGVTGMVLSPQPGPQGHHAQIDEARAKKWQERLDTTYGRENRGKALVTNVPVKLDQAEVDLDKLAMVAIRGISEERVCAVLGIPASVVGFGAGLRQTKIGAVMREQRGLAWENAVLPILDVLLDAFTRSLMPEFGAEGLRYGYLLPPGHVAALDAEVLMRTAALGYRSGIMQRAEARAWNGLPAESSDEVYATDLPRPPPAGSIKP